MTLFYCFFFIITRLFFYTIQAAAAKKHVLLKYAGFGRKSNKNNASGITGVALTRTGKYRAYISIGKHQIHLGVFATLGDARTARKAAEQRYFADRQEKADATLQKQDESLTRLTSEIKAMEHKQAVLRRQRDMWVAVAGSLLIYNMVK